MHMQVLYERHGKHSLERLTRDFFQASAGAAVSHHSVVTFDDFYRRFARPWPKVSRTHMHMHARLAPESPRRAAPCPREATGAACGHSSLALPQPLLPRACSPGDLSARSAQLVLEGSTGQAARLWQLGAAKGSRPAKQRVGAGSRGIGRDAVGRGALGGSAPPPGLQKLRVGP